MSLELCTLEAAENNLISDEMKEALLAAGKFNDIDVVNAALESAYLKRRQAALQIIKSLNALDTANSHPKGLLAGVEALITRDLYSQVGYENIDMAKKAVQGEFDRYTADMLFAFRSKRFGFKQDKEGLEDLVHGLFGKTTKNVETGLYAKQVSKVLEYARQRFNRAGGAISKLENYIPVAHSQRKIRGGKTPAEQAIAKKAWVNFMQTEVKMRQLTDSNGIELSPPAQAKVLEDMWESIAFNGARKIEAGKKTGTGKLANKHREKRIIHFEDPDSWLKYNKRFGDDDIFATLNGYMETMSGDIAAMEVFGPNPNLTMNFLSDTLIKNDVKMSKVKRANAIYEVQTGQGSLLQDIELAGQFQETRAWMTAALLGGAFLKSLGDVGLLAITARYNGLPVARAITRGVQQFIALKKEDQMLAAQMGIGANAVRGKMFGAEKFTGISSESGKLGTGRGSQASEFVMRSSFLTKWTEAMRTGFSIEFTGFVAKQSDKTYGELNPRLKKAFGKYGIEEAEWDLLRSMPKTKQDGAEFLTAENIMEAGLGTDAAESLHKKYMGMILQESEYAALTPDARTRATLGGGQKGTWHGEFLITTAMFKSFPLTMVNTHIMRGLNQSSLGDKMGYLGGLVMTTTAIAAMGLQATELSKGRDLRDMRPTTKEGLKFWGEALMTGGGLGIFADFVFQDHNRYGHEPLVTGGGPVFGAIQDTAGVVQSLVAAPFAEEGEKGEAFREVGGQTADLLKRYNPFDTWQTRLVMERVLFENMAMWADPNLKDSYEQKRINRQADYGNDEWWPQGDSAPDRLPTTSGEEEF